MQFPGSIKKMAAFRYNCEINGRERESRTGHQLDRGRPFISPLFIQDVSLAGNRVFDPTCGRSTPDPDYSLYAVTARNALV